MDYHRKRPSDGYSSPAQSEQTSHSRLGSATTNGSRPVSRTSYTPSYMSIPRKTIESANTSSTAVAPQIIPPEIASPSGPPGLMLVLIAGRPQSSILRHVETLLTRQKFAGIVYAATREHEAELKQLKVDTYALIGKLRCELSVDTQLKKNWSQADIESVWAEASSRAIGMQGVICCPEYANLVEDLDIFEVDQQMLQSSWQHSVAFLHAASRVAIPHLLSRAAELDSVAIAKRLKEPRGPFFIVVDSSTHDCASRLAKAAADALLKQLETATARKGLAVGYAGRLLVPDPEPKADPKPALKPRTLDIGFHDRLEEVDFTSGDSPTKLYSMWALQEQLDYSD